jgi:hypothetical protein
VQPALSIVAMKDISVQAYPALRLTMAFAVCVSLTLGALYQCPIRYTEPECCDGSDEGLGVCKDLCKEVGDVYRRQQAEELKTRKKVCSTYTTTSLSYITKCSGVQASFIIYRVRSQGEETVGGPHCDIIGGDFC